MARAGSIAYQVSKIIKEHNGIREKKREAREASNRTGENGHKVSDKFHSYKSLDNARRDLMNLGKFAKEEFGIKDMSMIDKEVVREWIKSKDISSYTASNYLSEINKVREHFNISKEEIKELRQEFHNTLEKTRERAEMTRAYKNIDRVEIAERSRIAFELQRDYGLRAKEATHIKVDKQLTGNILQVQAKGGKPVIVELDKKLADHIREVAKENNGIYQINYKTYTRDLKEALEAVGNKYNGTHGLRHSFAQNKLEEGYTKGQVSEMMGHVRENITDVYLR
jgi:integrase